MSKWIAVEWELPEHEEVIVYSGINKQVFGGVYYNRITEKWEAEDESFYIRGVTHWMPLPEPPTEEEL